MRPQERAMARRQIDKRLQFPQNRKDFGAPPCGWIRAIREALGMTTAQLGKRLGVSQPRAVTIEQAEKTGAITLDSLKRAARALDCDFVYALVPRRPLEDTVHDRALMLAKRRMSRTRHTMALEDQSVGYADEQAQLAALARRILEKPGSGLWDDE